MEKRSNNNYQYVNKSVSAKVNIRELTIKDLQEYVLEMGYEKFVGIQIFEWLHNKYEFSFDKMSNITTELRNHLKQNFYCDSVSLNKKLESDIGDVIKYLFELKDREMVEAVAMKYKFGYSLCISAQAGCKMGCKFCASSICDFSRNLSVTEMLDQIALVEKDKDQKINNLVLMGIGEPLENIDNVVRLIEILPSKYGIRLSPRKITVSTCGLVDKIYELMEHRLQITLSISLHAPNDEIRDKIMPINKKWNIASIMKAADDYFEVTSRRVSFEYVLIDRLNDSKENAHELVNLLGNRICHVNLIPLNNIKERNYKRSSAKKIAEFQQILRKSGINVTVRRNLGFDISAACGQLRKQLLTEQ